MSNFNDITNPKGTTILRVFAYGRVSSDQQVFNQTLKNNNVIKDYSASVKEQQKASQDFIDNYRGYCPKCGKTIMLILEDKFFDEGKSGTTTDREGIERARALGKEGKIDLFLSLEGDRFGRNYDGNQKIRYDFTRMGIQFCSVCQQKPIYCSSCYDRYDDDSGVISDFSNDMTSHLAVSRIRRNYKTGMADRIIRGLPTGSRGYGLILLKDENIGRLRIQEFGWDNAKIKIVKRIIHEYMDLGLGMWKISQRLNMENIPSPQDKKWGRSAVKHLLNNPIYAGNNRKGWKTTAYNRVKDIKIRVIQPKEKWVIEKAQWYNKRLWDWSYYEEILETIKKRNSMGGRASGSNALLIGLLKCGYCGYSMFQGNSKKIRENGDIYEWKGYVCGTYSHRGACRHNGKSQKVLDGIVIKEILKLAKNEKTREVYLKRIENQQKLTSKDALIEKEQALRELNKRYSRSTEAYLAGEFSLEQYSIDKKELIPRISQLEIELDKLRQSVSNPQKLNPDFFGVIEKVRKEYETGDYKSLQQLLRKIIVKVEFKKKPENVKIIFRNVNKDAQ